MPQKQPDLFAGAGLPARRTTPRAIERSRPAPAALANDALIAAIPDASLADCDDLAAEAGRRGLVQAIPALEALCRRFKGFGTEHAIPEQSAALDGLAAIGGRDAAATVARIIVGQVIQGPGLKHAVAVAARLGARLPGDVVVSLLRHAVPDIRANACGCAHPWPDAMAELVELLRDRNGAVARAAACALGRIGRVEGRPSLLRLLRHDPSVEVIEAVGGIADEECVVLLGRIARTRPDLAEAALAALDGIDAPRAAKIAAAVRGV